MHFFHKKKKNIYILYTISISISNSSRLFHTFPLFRVLLLSTFIHPTFCTVANIIFFFVVVVVDLFRFFFCFVLFFILPTTKIFYILLRFIFYSTIAHTSCKMNMIIYWLLPSFVKEFIIIEIKKKLI